MSMFKVKNSVLKIIANVIKSNRTGTVSYGPFIYEMKGIEPNCF